MSGEDGHERRGGLLCEEAMLRALPPNRPLHDSREFDQHEAMVREVLASVSSFETPLLKRRLEDRADELGRRFQRFGADRQMRLLRLLTWHKRLAAMRADELAAPRPDPRASPAPAPRPAVMEIATQPPVSSRGDDPPAVIPSEDAVDAPTDPRPASDAPPPSSVQPIVVEEEPPPREVSPLNRSLREHWDARYPLFRANLRHAVAHVAAVHLHRRERDDGTSRGPLARLERAIRDTLGDRISRLAPSLGDLVSEVVGPDPDPDASAAFAPDLEALWRAPLGSGTFGAAIAHALGEGRIGRAFDRNAAELTSPISEAVIDGFVAPLRRAPLEHLERWGVDYDPSTGDDWFHGGAAWLDYLADLDSGGSSLSGMTLVQRIAALRRLVAPQTARAAGGRVLELFETAPAIERASIYEAVAGHAWSGDRSGRDAIELALTRIQARRFRELIDEQPSER